MFCKINVLKNFQNSQENSCARASFVIKLQAEATRTPQVAASVFKQDKLIGLISTTWNTFVDNFSYTKSSPQETLLVKRVLKIYSKFAGEHPYRSVMSIKLQSNFIEITLSHGCSPVNLLYIFTTPFPKNTS